MTKPFKRFARHFGISDDLWLILQGPFDANLGGEVFKYRLARSGEGVSGGARALIAIKQGLRAVCMFGFEKKDMSNITPDELKQYRKAAKIYLAYSERQITSILKAKALFEIVRTNEGEIRGKNVQKQSARSSSREHE